MIQSGHCRVLLDSVSETNFITNRLSQLLAIKKHGRRQNKVVHQHLKPKMITFVGKNRYNHKKVGVLPLTVVNSTFGAEFTTFSGKNLHFCVVLSVFTDKSG
jgi:hypothetical protein